jgi:hypothetical protein
MFYRSSARAKHDRLGHPRRGLSPLLSITASGSKFRSAATAATASRSVCAAFCSELQIAHKNSRIANGENSREQRAAAALSGRVASA